MKWTRLFLLLILFSCQSKQKEEPEQENNASQSIVPDAENKFDYNPLFGVYDHESSTSAFSGVVSLRQNGLDLYFTVSVVQGTCKAETEGVIVMAEHTENYYVGFADIENCPMQITFYSKDGKIDIKEVSLCTIHGSTCAFEGVYVKRSEEFLKESRH